MWFTDSTSTLSRGNLGRAFSRAAFALLAKARDDETGRDQIEAPKLV